MNDNMVDVIDPIGSDCGAFRSNCFLVKERKNVSERRGVNNATSRKVNDA